MSVTIHCATSRSQIRQWVRFPQVLHQEFSQWSPPLWSDENYSRSNVVLAHGDFVLHYAMRDQRIVGRNLVYINHEFNTYYSTKTGMFGAFEAVDDLAVSRALFEAGYTWLSQHGMTHVRGPIQPVAEVMGLLLSGFDSPAVFMTPWNPPYYDKLFADSGMLAIQDLLAYSVDSNSFTLHSRYSEFYEHFFKRNPGYTVRSVYTDHRINDEARWIMELANAGLAGNWGFVPADLPTMRDMLQRLRPIIDADAIKFVEYQGKPVAFCLGYPDLNIILRKTKGRLFPTGWFHVLRAKKTLKDYRLFGLVVHPEHHNKGLDAILFVELTKALQPRGIRLEANWVLEDNIRMNNSLKRLNISQHKTYRVYERQLP